MEAEESKKSKLPQAEVQEPQKPLVADQEHEESSTQTEDQKNLEGTSTTDEC